MSLRVERYHPAAQAVWDAFVAGSRNGTFLAERRYVEHHAEPYDDHSVLIFSGSSPIAVMPANAEAQTIVTHAGLTYGGLIVAAGASDDDVRCAMAAAADYYASCAFTSLVYRRADDAFIGGDFADDLAALMGLHATLVASRTLHVLDRDLPGRLDPMRRRGLAKAKRAGVRIARGQDFVGFWREVLEPCLASRHGARPVHGGAEMARLADAFPERIRLYEARLGDAQVAGAVVYVKKDCAHVQYFGSTELGRACSALDLVVHELFQHEFRNLRFLSFGSSNDPATLALNPSLARWKEGFGALPRPLEVYRLALSAKKSPPRPLPSPQYNIKLLPPASMTAG